MSQTIMTNVASLNSQRQLNKSQSALNTSLERLSSGLRINSAKDDAAGLAISDRMTSQINGLDQAVSNSNDGISLAQTAESALGTITDNLQRIRELAVQSANATNSASDRASIQAEVSQLSDEITRVAKDTQFNGINLLDGTFSNQVFQVGANAGQTITVDTISSAKASALGVEQLSSDGTAMGAIETAASGAAPANGLATQTLTLTNSAVGGTVTAPTVTVTAGTDDAATIAASINSAGSSIGVTATASNSMTLSGIASNGNITFTLNGGGTATAITANSVTSSDYTNLVTAINAKTSETGVSASFTTSGVTSKITLTSADGSDIEIQDFANSGAGATDTLAVLDAGTSGATSMVGGTNVSATKTGTVTINSTEGSLSISGSSADLFTQPTSGDVTSVKSTVEDIDVSTAAGATAAISVVDAALSAIDSARGDLGAIQNRFTSVVSNLQSSSENMSASRSRIQDADFAAETAAMSKNQILQQAGTAMLAQANSLPQNVLTLLQ